MILAGTPNPNAVDTVCNPVWLANGWNFGLGPVSTIPFVLAYSLFGFRPCSLTIGSLAFGIPDSTGTITPLFYMGDNTYWGGLVPQCGDCGFGPSTTTAASSG